LKRSYVDDRESIVRINLSSLVNEVGCEMDRNGLALCLMAGWGVKTSDFAVIYLYCDVEEMNIHSCVTLKRTVLPLKHMSYFQKVSIILHENQQDESHHLPCIATNLYTDSALWLR